VNQEPLFPDDEPRHEAYARRTDPWTSWFAAKSLSEEQLRESQVAVLACFRLFGAMTHESLCETYDSHRPFYGWPRQRVSGLRTRTSELVDAGYVRDTGRFVRLPDSRRPSKIWEAV
jgi:hypothetical protein